MSQLNAADWINYSNDSVYGTVVSDVNQQVYIPDDKVINEVYVAQGDEVKIGDKLLSYDTTLLELDLELQELTVQEIDLEIESAEADLKKLKNTTPVAKSSSDDDELLGPNQSLPGALDGGEEARMVPAKNLLLAAASGVAATSILPVEVFTKGLEFDAVLLYHPTEAHYPAIRKRRISRL